MFQEMINGSIAVISRPSVSTFEEHEKNNLSWALIYTLIGAVISSILAAINSAIFSSEIDPEQAAQLEQLGMDPATLSAQPGGIGGAVVGALIFATIGFFIYYGLVYLLGRAFGGTGQFGELTYDISLFAAPLGVVSSILSFIPFVGAIAGFVLLFYNIYLTYLGIQSGMNLPGNKALYVVLIIVAIVILFALCVGVIFGAAFLALLGASQ
ncbi:MAG: YIP1 family protein [Chloroflexales bacterium]|nr:YIP1 family protein [Chloroflexales bacterium]